MAAQARRTVFGRFLIGVVLVSLVAGFTTVNGSGVGHASAQTLPPDRWADLREAMEQAVVADAAPGVGLVVVHRDRGIVFHEHFGDFGPDRASMIASSGKLMSAGVLMALEEQGLLDLDAPVADQVPWDGVHEGVTPVNLVSNTSGLVGLLPNFLFGPYLCQFAPSGWTLTDCGSAILTTVEDDLEVVAPDTEFRYGGGQWQAAGAVAEQVSGKSWAQLIDEIYVQPCGLVATGYQSPGALGSAGGYPVEFNGADPTVHPPAANPNIEGGAYTTTTDYAQILLMHLRGGQCPNGRVFTEQGVERLHTSRIDPPGYGMGWWVDSQTNVLTSAGLWGAFPFVNVDAGYAGYWVVEGGSAALGGVQAGLLNEVHRIMTDENVIGKFDAPTVSIESEPAQTITLDSDYAEASIWYTVDGTDPAGLESLISATALAYDGPITLTDGAEVTARAYEPTIGWSDMATSGTTSDMMPGDANCDGVSTVVDALYVAQYGVGLRAEASCPLTEPAIQIDLTSADMNTDERVDIVDALLIARCSVGACLS